MLTVRHCSRTNRQTTPRFRVKAQATNSQRKTLPVKGLGSNIKKISVDFSAPQNVKVGYGPGRG